MSASHCYFGMEYSDNRAKIAEWACLAPRQARLPQPPLLSACSKSVLRANSPRAAGSPKLKEIIPTYGIDLTQDAAALRRKTGAILKVENI